MHLLDALQEFKDSTDIFISAVDNEGDVYRIEYDEKSESLHLYYNLNFFSGVVITKRMLGLDWTTIANTIEPSFQSVLDKTITHRFKVSYPPLAAKIKELTSYYRDLDWILFQLSRNCSAAEIKEVILNGKWKSTPNTEED